MKLKGCVVETVEPKPDYMLSRQSSNRLADSQTKTFVRQRLTAETGYGQSQRRIRRPSYAEIPANGGLFLPGL